MVGNKTTGVAFFGKVRIPTLGHKKAIEQAAKIAETVGGQLHVGLTGNTTSLSPDQKKMFSETLFGYPVESGDHTKNLINFLSKMAEQHDELHLVAGSDRAGEYRRVISKYNGKEDSQGNIPFQFKEWRVHEVLRPGTDVSATLLEDYVTANDYKGFKAYYPGVSDQYTRKLFETVKKKSKLTGRNVLCEVSVPAIGQTLSRDLMPQISGKSLSDFLRFLKKRDIEFHKEDIDPSTLKSTQSEFDDSKIFKMMYDTDSNDPIIVSNDEHVLDGHHRWLADFNTNQNSTEVYVIDLPILELYRVAKEYCSSLNESIDHKEFGPMVDSFVSFASEKLGIKSLPQIELGGECEKSFGGYAPGNKSLSIITKNRHPLDIFRTLAHELVHHKQNEDGKLKDIAKAGETGSPIEDEANSMAGRLMRMYGQENPSHFKLPGLTEATFVVGVPCSGKDAIIRNLTTEDTQEIDIIKLFGASDLSETVIVSSSAEDVDTIRMAKKLLEDNGYITNLVFVDVNDNISKYRNEQRRERGQRVLNESIRFTKYNKAKENMKTLKEMFGYKMEVVFNDVLVEGTRLLTPKRKAFLDKRNANTTEGRMKAKIPEFTDDELEDHIVKLFPYTTREKAQRSSHDPKAPIDLTKPLPDSVQAIARAAVYHFEAGIREKQEGIKYKHQPSVDSGHKTILAASRVMKRHVGEHFHSLMKDNQSRPVLKSLINQNEPIKESIVGRAISKVKSYFREDNSSYKREEGTTPLRRNYTRKTPGQKMKEDGIGPTIKTDITSLNGITESIQDWASKPETIERYNKRYGNQAQRKLNETVSKIKKLPSIGTIRKTVTSIRENWDSISGADMGTVPNTGKEELIHTEDGKKYKKLLKRKK